MSNVAERRKSRRRPILDTFSIFLVVPSKGPHRLKVIDVSDLGVGFEADFEVTQGETLEARFYLNQSLSLPLTLQVARIGQQKSDAPGLVGASIVNPLATSYRAFASFIHLIDALSETQ